MAISTILIIYFVGIALVYAMYAFYLGQQVAEYPSTKIEIVEDLLLPAALFAFWPVAAALSPFIGPFLLGKYLKKRAIKKEEMWKALRD